ncbi:PspC domain-containing protein [Zhouia sp. PK063]|uniref:PspC domain-containing protein n=1 Tax=Zhouia sp. PK063 TaxID=3373602 RepID=UPI00379FA598
MNKTVNINLANTFFHIDEDAYAKLLRYLEAVKRSFKNTAGEDEIIADIEARVAELFAEKLQSERQVITSKEVDEVIAVMGQPEDYMVDEEIFDDEPPVTKRKRTSKKSNTHKQLYRDIDHKYIAGVSSGLSYYANIDAIWIRLLWVFLTIFTWGGFLFVYILLWVVMPEARTTAQKLAMRGEDVNISNIEKKIREGFDDVAEKVKSVNYNEMGQKVKKNSKNFFESIGSAIVFVLKIILKIVGIIILIITGLFLIFLISTLIVALTSGTFWTIPLSEIYEQTLAYYPITPIWLITTLSFLMLAIPVFFIFYLALKMIFTSLKSIGTAAKIILISLWVLSLIAFGIIIFKEVMAVKYDGHISNTESIKSNGNLYVAMKYDRRSKSYTTYKYSYNIGGVRYSKTEVRNGIVPSQRIYVDFSPTNDSIPYVEVVKTSVGNSVEEAERYAEKIEYNILAKQDTLILDNYLKPSIKFNKNKQDVNVHVYIPKSTQLKLAENAEGYISTRNFVNHIDDEDFTLSGNIWKMNTNDEKLHCLSCEAELKQKQELEKQQLLEKQKDSLKNNTEN